jgi:hypothetical protein
LKEVVLTGCHDEADEIESKELATRRMKEAAKFYDDTQRESVHALDHLGAKMRCDKCGKRPARYYPANQSDTPGFVRSF